MLGIKTAKEPIVVMASYLVAAMLGIGAASAHAATAGASLGNTQQQAWDVLQAG
jgi:hypothetical protein